MSKSEQTGGGGGGPETTPRTERKPLGKRPWRKPRVRLVEFAATKGAGVRASTTANNEGSHPTSHRYDPNIS